MKKFKVLIFKPWTRENYDKALNKINDSNSNSCENKTQNQYYLYYKYDLIDVVNIKQAETKAENIIYIVIYENYLEKIEKVIKQHGYGRRVGISKISTIIIIQHSKYFINQCTICN